MQSAALSFDSRAAHSAKNAPCELSNTECPSSPFFAHVPSSVPQQHGAEGMTEAIGEKRRKSDGSYDDRSETRTSLHVRLVQNVTEPTKDVLRKVRGISADSIDAYRQKSVPMSWAQMVAFGRAYPGFALDVMEMMGIDIDRDRDAYAQFIELQRRIRGQ